MCWCSFVLSAFVNLTWLAVARLRRCSNSCLQELERELKPYYAGDPDQRVWRSPDERARCAKQASECNTLLEEIVRLEKLGAEIVIEPR